MITSATSPQKGRKSSSEKSRKANIDRAQNNSATLEDYLKLFEVPKEDWETVKRRSELLEAKALKELLDGTYW
jgi:hypothetical protein